MTPPARLARPALALERAGIVIALAAAVLKAGVTISPFPGWEFDPFAFPSPPTGIGPAGSLICDTAIALGAIFMLIARALLGAFPPLLSTILFIAGAIGIAVHSFPPSAHRIAEVWTGSSWLAAMLLAFAIATTPRDERAEGTRALLAAIFLGFVAVLAVRGFQQYFIDHPATLADFKRNREAIFAAQGWTPDSPMAKAYERRVSQPEATGWFGLANVYATFAAAGTVMGLALFAGAVRSCRHAGDARPSPTLLAASALPLAAGIGGLLLAGGKGGFLAALLGVGVAIALLLPTSVNLANRLGARARTLAGIITTGALAATIALVMVRGLVGDRISELSLLFRWFYMQAAVRIGIEHFPLGVGPDGFQAAYMLAKNPLSPEDVTSSHNMLLDWFATLGVFGVAWAVLWLLWIWRAGAACAPAPVAEAPPAASVHRADGWTLFAIGVVPTFIAIRIDQHILSTDMAAVRLLGLAAFVGVGLIILSLWRHVGGRAAQVALAAGAAAAAAHALIDVTGVWPASVAMLAILAGLAASAGRSSPGPRLRMPGMLAIACVALPAALIPLFVYRALWWESRLRSTAAEATSIATLYQQWNEALDGLRTNRPGARELAFETAAQLSVQPFDPGKVEEALRLADLNATRYAAFELTELGTGMMPAEWKVRREASRLRLREAALLDALGDSSEARLAMRKAEEVLTGSLPRPDQTASELAWLALVRDSIGTETDTPEKLHSAAEALEQAATLAPNELEYAVRLMRLYERAGRPENARRWATRALELDAGLRYDREIKAMSPEDREDAVRLAGGS